MREALDRIDPWLLFAGTLLILIAASEAGFRIARGRGDEGHKGLASTLLSAVLVLLGFQLGISFSIAETRFADRRQLVLDEANAIGTTYLRAQMLPQPHDEQVRALLRKYVDLRLAATRPENVPRVLAESESVHAALWRHAVAAAEADSRSLPAALFVTTLNEVIDLHQKRVTTVLHRRLPLAILICLSVVAVVAMLIQGYSAGLTSTRAPLPTAGMIVSIAAVLLLIVDLDRPHQTVFTVSQSALESLRGSMAKDR